LDQNYPKLKDKIISKISWNTTSTKFWRKTIRDYREFSIQYFDTNCI
jgi:hypothetical protein